MALKDGGDERGAALFMVVLIVTLLTAIGTFAIHTTSMAQLAAGYSRREASALGRSFAVKGLSPRLRELASLYGIAGLLPAAP